MALPYRHSSCNRRRSTAERSRDYSAVFAGTHAEDANNELEYIAELMFPPSERIDWLHKQFEEVNEIVGCYRLVAADLWFFYQLLSSPLGVEGRVYGSLVNGFPTAHSDIDVAVELRDDVKEELL